ncbi:MAG: hypothetical protein ACLS3T_06670 [Anaerobutyricum sp.]
MDKELNRMSFIIMNQMLKAQATDFMHSLSCEEIRQQIKIVETCTVYKYIRKLERLGFVEKGAKVTRAYGYILTKKAIELLPKQKEE